MNINYIQIKKFIELNQNNLTEIKNQYLKLLSELTVVSDLTDEQFINQINKICDMGIIIIAVQSELNEFEIVGSGTVIIEPKIMHGAKSVGHIEDIVVKHNWRGKKISQNILNELKKYSKEKNCYKIILDCVDAVVPVYKSVGFQIKGNQMSYYFD
jgi:glucosamine-phosphate N-acetyltransferase